MSEYANAVVAGRPPVWADGKTRPLSRRKGLSNELGENNCFLNVIIQSLWHVRSCRVLISMGDHAVHHRCGGGQLTQIGATKLLSTTACLLCELEQIFILYQFAEEPVLDVDRVRLALGELFALGAMNDATETLEAILDALHWDTFNRMLTLRRGEACLHANVEELSQSTLQDASSIICEPQCVAHLLFQMNLMELKTCAQCGETREPIMNTDFLYRVYAQELLQHAKKKKKSLEQVLRLEAQGQPYDDTPDEDAFVGICDTCQGKLQLSRWILTLPMVFAISIIWSSDQVNKEEVRAWMELLSSQNDKKKNQQTLNLGNIFHLDKSAGAADYNFRGMVCYYGRHYVGFFASHAVEDGIEKEQWFLFDDTRVKRVGTWDDVRYRIERGGYQPTLLFYERSDIQHEKLERIAEEIHKWWESTAEEEEARQKEAKDKQDEAAASTVNDAVTVDSDQLLLAQTLKESLRIRRPPSTMPMTLPTSPIQAQKLNAPMTLPANNGTAKNNWHDEDLYLMHKSAEDTLSRLNGILSKDRAPMSLDNGRDLWMSMSMRQSTRRRDYSVRRLGNEEPVINRDEIFKDLTEDAVHLKPLVAVDTKRSRDQALSFDLENGKASAQTNEAHSATINNSNEHAPLKVFDVQLSASDGGLGLLLEEKPAVSKNELLSDGKLATCDFIVSGFELNGAGQKLAAEASGAIRKGDHLVSINGQSLESQALFDVLELLWTSPNPVRLQFHRFQPWTCPRCTLVNETKTAICAACGHAVELTGTAQF